MTNIDRSIVGRYALNAADQWQVAVAAYETARDAYPPSQGTADDDTDLSLWEAYNAAWEKMIDTPAPDAAASVYKLRAVIAVEHCDVIGDGPDNPVTLQRMYDGPMHDGFWMVCLLRDACLQAGLSHPSIEATQAIRQIAAPVLS